MTEIDFVKGEMQQSFAKVGLLGFAGSGKSYTAHEIAMGLHRLIGSQKPVTCIETESGVDFMIKRYHEAGIEILTAKTRAFSDLMGANGRSGLTAKVIETSDILVIDSVTHFWVDIVESYRIKNNLSRLRFQDWGIIKPMWGKFTDFFLKSEVHIIICGRAGYEYDYFEDEEGKMELYKTGTKMKVETEMGYEPSLLIEMERARTEVPKKSRKKSGREMQSKVQIGTGWIHRAHILKDRSQILDGLAFDNPSFTVFEPHFSDLNLGGKHFVETGRDSTELFRFEGKPDWKVEQQRKEILRAELRALIEKLFPGANSNKDKRARILVKELVFGVRSDESLEALTLPTLKEGCEFVEKIMKSRENVDAFLEESEEELAVRMNRLREELQYPNPL